jgi:hypothetical protein
LHVSMSARWPITFPIQIVGIHMQKVPKPAHYLSGFSQKPIPTPLPPPWEDNGN